MKQSLWNYVSWGRNRKIKQKESKSRRIIEKCNENPKLGKKRAKISESHKAGSTRKINEINYESSGKNEIT